MATTLLDEPFGVEHLTGLRRAVAARARTVGLVGDRLEDFVLAVNELATNAVRHGGGSGRLTLRRVDDTLICEVTDRGGGLPDGAGAVVGPPASDHPGGRGLFLAHQLTETLLLTSGATGLTASVVVCLDASGSVATPRPLVGEVGR